VDRPRYVDLYFGLSDSRNEAAEDRDAFVRTYVDIHGVAAAVVSGQKFLVLGPKGTGKSALAWYLEATEMDGNRLALVSIRKLRLQCVEMASKSG
jgi:DNA helicase TIP49 (TBP-interacting protein)